MSKAWNIGDRRAKTDWAGITLADGFRHDADYYTRIAAQRLFYAAAHKVSKAAESAAGVDTSEGPAPEPQVSAFYTRVPLAIAGHAALGHTAFVHFAQCVSHRSLTACLQHYLENIDEYEVADVDRQVFSRVAAEVAQIIETRILLEDLSRAPGLQPIETYRLFLASQHSLRFRCLSEIVSAVVLFGDVLPPLKEGDVHPLTRDVLEEVGACSRDFIARLPITERYDLLALGTAWVRILSAALARFLPPPRPIDDDEADQWIEAVFEQMQLPEERRFAHPECDVPASERVSPLGQPTPPALFAPSNPGEQVGQSLGEAQQAAARGRFARPFAGDDQANAVASRALPAAAAQLGAALAESTAQGSSCEDLRSDLVEQALCSAPFAAGPMTGTPVDGHSIEVNCGGQRALAGDVFDRAVAPAPDEAVVARLRAEAEPVTRALRSALYPDVVDTPRVETLRTCGSLDPARLALAEVSPAVWRRRRNVRKPERRGRAVLLIACDGSGSLDHDQMQLVKLLATAWLDSTAGTGIEVVAGLYHSGEVRAGLCGTLVQWMRHPHKTPATSARAAVGAVAALPDTGTGIQADALSLSFMFDEAERIGRGAQVYSIVLSDCAWNVSAPDGCGYGQEEVAGYFRELRRRRGARTHTTLVAIGCHGDTGIDEVVDRVIRVEPHQVADRAQVAESISMYVADVMGERRRMLARQEGQL